MTKRLTSFEIASGVPVLDLRIGRHPLATAITLIFVAAFFVSVADCPAGWAQPIRVETSSTATRLFLGAQADYAAGRVSAAAGQLADLLQVDVTERVDWEGRSVHPEVAVAAWLAEIEAESNGAVRAAVVARAGALPGLPRWFDPSSLESLRRRVAVLRDAGLADAAAAITSPVSDYGSLIPPVLRRQLLGSRTVESRPAVQLDEPGWVVGIPTTVSPLDRSTLIELRMFGVAPQLTSEPVEYGRQVFVRDAVSLHAFERADGHHLWTAPVANDAGARLPKDDIITRTLTTSLLGPVRCHDGRVLLVGFVGPSPSSLSSASGRRQLGLHCIDATNGHPHWVVETPGVPLASPIVVGNRVWFPMRVGRELGMSSVDLATGDNLATYRAAELADRGSRQIASLYRAAFESAGTTLLVAFDEGLAGRFDTASGSWLWLRPIGVAGNAEVRELSDEADVTGGPYVMLPRVRDSRPVAVVGDGQRMVTLGCPGWTEDLTMDLRTGASLPAEPIPETRPRWQPLGVDYVDGHQGEPGHSHDGRPKRFVVTPAPILGTRVIGPRPFAVGGANNVYVQTETELRRLCAADFVTDRVQSERPFARAVSLVIAVLEGRTSALAALLFNQGSLYWDDGVQAGTVLPDLLTARSTSTYADEAARGPTWLPNVEVSQVDRQRNRFLDRFEPVSIERVADGGPTRLAISVNAMNRRFLRLRADGDSLGEIALPGRHGDNRINESLHRAWQIGPTVVLQLGRELFGLTLTRGASEVEPDRSVWRADVAWPTAGGYPVGSERRSLLPVSRFTDRSTRAGPVVVGEDGRLVGNVGVTNEAIVVAKLGVFITLDPAGGRVLSVLGGRRPEDVVVGTPEGVVVVDLETMSVALIDAARLSRRRVLSNQDDLLRIHSTGVWWYDKLARRLSHRSWQAVLIENGTDADLDQDFSLKSVEHVSFGARAAVVYEADEEQFSVHAVGRHAQSFPAEAVEAISHVVLLETPDVHLVGLSRTVNEPGLVDRLQSLSGRRTLFAGKLFAVSNASGDAAGELRWQTNVTPLALTLNQPPDVPLVIADWNAKVTQPNGKLSSLHVGHVRVWDRRTGERLADERSRSPQRPAVTIQPEEQLVRLELGETEFRLQFVND